MRARLGTIHRWVGLATVVRFTVPSTGPGSRLALGGSLLLLLAPALMVVGFVTEPMASGRLGPASGLGVIVAFLGFGAYALGTWRR